jgi:hypothetical protein
LRAEESEISCRLRSQNDEDLQKRDSGEELALKTKVRDKSEIRIAP